MVNAADNRINGKCIPVYAYLAPHSQCQWYRIVSFCLRATCPSSTHVKKPFHPHHPNAPKHIPNNSLNSFTALYLLLPVGIWNATTGSLCANALSIRKNPLRSN